MTTSKPRLILTSLFVLFLAFVPSALAQEITTADEPLGRVARLSDAEVRALLLQELEEKEQAAAAGRAADNPAITSIQIQKQVGWLVGNLAAKFGAVSELPDIWRKAGEKLSALRENRTLGAFLIGALISFGTGFLVEFGLFRLLSPARKWVRDLTSSSLAGRVGALGAVALLRTLRLIVFVLVAVGVYMLFFNVDPTDRITFFFYVSALVIFRVAAVLSHFWHAPNEPQLRLPTLGDQVARHLHQTLLIAVALGGFGFYTCALFGLFGIHGHAHGLLLILVGTATTIALMMTFVGSRRAIASMIVGRTDDAPLVRMTVARLWPWFLAILILVIWCYLVIKQFIGGHVGYGAGLLTLALAALLPGIDAILIDEANEPATNEVQSAVLRTFRLAVPFLAVLVLAGAWRLNLTSMAEEGIMGALANGAMQITATLFIAYLIWQVIHIWIDRAIAREDAEMAASGHDIGEMEIGGAGLSRIRTLLPLIKSTIRVVLGAMALMIMLSALAHLMRDELADIA